MLDHQTCQQIFLCKFQVKPKWQVKQKEVGWDPWGPWDERFFFLGGESIFPILTAEIFPATCSFLRDNKRTGANGSKKDRQTPSDLLILTCVCIA